MLPQKYQVLIPGPLNITLFEKRVFADVIALRILRSEDNFGVFRWSLNAITCVLIRERQTEMVQTHRGARNTKLEQRKM